MSEENGRYLVNTVASFSCNSGYYQNGVNSATCETSGNWNKEIPTCEGFYCSFCLSDFTWSIYHQHNFITKNVVSSTLFSLNSFTH